MLKNMQPQKGHWGPPETGPFYFLNDLVVPGQIWKND
jgi:hypothetical protein